jgi:hypothetical protein
MGGCVVCLGEIRNTYKVLVRKVKGRNHMEELHRLKDNTKVDIKEMA